jgi:anti-anti-sigma regulatory factor
MRSSLQESSQQATYFELTRTLPQNEAPMEINGTFQIEQQDDTVVVTPLIDLRELEYELIERDGKTLLDRLAAADAKNVVVDFDKTDYYGSTALGFFVKLWK